MAEPALVVQGGGLEVPLAIGTKPRAHGIERTTVAQRSQCIVRAPRLPCGVMHVVGDDPRHTDAPRERNELSHECALLGKPVIPDLDRERVVEQVTQRAGHAVGFSHVADCQGLWYRPTWTSTEGEQSGRVLCEQCEWHRWRAALRHIHARTGEQCAEIAIADA